MKQSRGGALDGPNTADNLELVGSLTKSVYAALDGSINIDAIARHLEGIDDSLKSIRDQLERIADKMTD